jgi:hypothetical protein
MLPVAVPSNEGSASQPIGHGLIVKFTQLGVGYIDSQPSDTLEIDNGCVQDVVFYDTLTGARPTNKHILQTHLVNQVRRKAPHLFSKEWRIICREPSMASEW